MSDSRLECSFRLFMSHAIKSMTDGFDISSSAPFVGVVIWNGHTRISGKLSTSHCVVPEIDYFHNNIQASQLEH